MWILQHILWSVFLVVSSIVLVSNWWIEWRVFPLDNLSGTLWTWILFWNIVRGCFFPWNCTSTRISWISKLIRVDVQRCGVQKSLENVLCLFLFLMFVHRVNVHYICFYCLSNHFFHDSLRREASLTRAVGEFWILKIFVPHQLGLRAWPHTLIFHKYLCATKSTFFLMNLISFVPHQFVRKEKTHSIEKWEFSEDYIFGSLRTSKFRGFPNGKPFKKICTHFL